MPINQLQKMFVKYKTNQQCNYLNSQRAITNQKVHLKK